jgi:hypothetical protein
LVIATHTSRVTFTIKSGFNESTASAAFRVVDGEAAAMRTLYVSQQGCYVALQQETLLVKQGETIHARVQLPLLEQILIFGKSQVTTQVIRTCLWRDILNRNSRTACSL